jgi:hypothetical protein
MSGFGCFTKHALHLRRPLRNTLRVVLSLVLAFQPVLAYAQEIIIDPSGNVGSMPRLKPVSGNTPVIDIAKPNTGGVSLNQFTSFNVTANGVVLNNSATGVST